MYEVVAPGIAVIFSNPKTVTKKTPKRRYDHVTHQIANLPGLMVCCAGGWGGDGYWWIVMNRQLQPICTFNLRPLHTPYDLLVIPNQGHGYVRGTGGPTRANNDPEPRNGGMLTKANQAVVQRNDVSRG